MQDKRKDQILSSWTEPPFEAPQVHLPPNKDLEMEGKFFHCVQGPGYSLSRDSCRKTFPASGVPAS
jgi:hypothetical protein